MAKLYPINMVRMDVEEHEYHILSKPVPNQIDSLCIVACFASLQQSAGT
jgi:hypothetical protein